MAPANISRASRLATCGACGTIFDAADALAAAEPVSIRKPVRKERAPASWLRVTETQRSDDDGDTILTISWRGSPLSRATLGIIAVLLAVIAVVMWQVGKEDEAWIAVGFLGFTALATLATRGRRFLAAYGNSLRAYSSGVVGRRSGINLRNPRQIFCVSNGPSVSSLTSGEEVFSLMLFVLDEAGKQHLLGALTAPIDTALYIERRLEQHLGIVDVPIGRPYEARSTSETVGLE